MLRLNIIFGLVIKNQLVLLLLLLQAFVVVANPVVYDDASGLSNSQITAIGKGKSGVMWVGTESGLNIFDGYTFSEINALKTTRINTMLFDTAHGNMWIGTDKGLFVIDEATQLVKQQFFNGDKASGVLLVTSFNNNIFVVFFNGKIIKFNRDFSYTTLVDLFKKGAVKDGLKRMAVTNANGKLYVAPTDANYVVQVVLNNAQIKLIPTLYGVDLWDMILVADTCVLLYNVGQTKYIDKTGEMLPLQAKQLPLTYIFNYGNQQYVSIKNRYGLYCTTNDLNPLVDDELIFKLKNVTTVFCDEHQVIWVGTNKGLIKIAMPVKQPFSVLFDGFNIPISTRQIVKGNTDEYYIATYNGIYLYNQRQQSLTHVKPQKMEAQFPLYARSLWFDGKYLFAGVESNEHYFYRYNTLTKNFETRFFKIVPTDAHINSVFGIFKSSNNVFWLATDKGLASYHPQTETMVLHQQGKYSVGNLRLFYIKQASSPNEFWLSGKESVFLINVFTGVKYSCKSDGSEKLQLPKDDYIFVTEDDNGKVWLGSKKSGLIVLNRQRDGLTVINRSSGLSNNEVYGVQWQTPDIAWVCTKNGLCRLQVSANKFTNFFAENGLSDNEFNQNSFIADKDKFYFGGINGINYFNPHLLNIQNTAVGIFTTSITKWNKSEKKIDGIQPTQKIVMQPDDHLLTFTLGLSDYSSTEANTFFYRIQGLYNDWISLGTQNVLRLEGLNAGEYKIEIMGFNKRGIQSNILVYSISIAQVFYKTGWFYVLFALVLVLMVYVYFKWRLQNIHQKQLLRTQIASNLHDEVGSLLTSIIISTDSARYSAQTVDEKNQKLEKISSLSRDATNTMSDVLWSIDARNDYAGNLTDRMREHAEQMLHALDIDVEFDFTETQQQQVLNPDTRQQLYLIFKEAINNIVKHSKATNVKVSYKLQGKFFELNIENNNLTFHDATQLYSGQGLKNIHMRAKKIHAQCEIENNQSTFTVRVKSI